MRDLQAAVANNNSSKPTNAGHSTLAAHSRRPRRLSRCSRPVIVVLLTVSHIFVQSSEISEHDCQEFGQYCCSDTKRGMSGVSCATYSVDRPLQ